MTLANPPDTTRPPDYAALGATSLAAIAVLQLAYHLRNWRLPAKDNIVRIDSRAWDPNWSEGPAWTFLSYIYTAILGPVRGMNLLTDRSSSWPG